MTSTATSVSTSSPARCGPARSCSASPRTPTRCKPIARLNHPAHIEPVDLDKDGRGDFLVADLGSFQPADHSEGAVYWLRGRADGSYVTVPLATKLPRTSDARAADFDGDGDLDVIVGSFGWRTTGNVTLLENRTTDWKTPAFVAEAD